MIITDKYYTALQKKRVIFKGKSLAQKMLSDKKTYNLNNFKLHKHKKATQTGKLLKAFRDISSNARPFFIYYFFFN